MRLLRAVSLADVFTLVNASAGFLAILALSRLYGVSSFHAQSTDIVALSPSYLEPDRWGPSVLALAISLVLIGILADGLDGIVARRFAQKWVLGDYLDLMADTISFAIAPGILYAIFLPEIVGGTPAGMYGRWLVFFPGLVVLPLIIGTLLRLARFAYSKGGRAVAFRGLPSPASGLTIVLAMLVVLLSPNYIQDAWWLVAFVLLLPFLLCLLMISEIPYPKVRGAEAVVSAALLILVVSVLLMGIGGSPLTFALAALAGAHVAYLVGGPFIASSRLVDRYDPRAWEAPADESEQEAVAERSPRATIPSPPKRRVEGRSVATGLKRPRPVAPSAEEE